jgi:hypothetical protein
MSPSEHQPQGDHDYATPRAYKVAEWPDYKLLAMKCMTEQAARAWLGECNRLRQEGVDVSDEVVEHFAEQVRENV